MEVRIRADSVEIMGYVNAVERKSKPLWSRIGQFVERIRSGAFKKALERNDNVRILLNHNPSRDLGGMADGNLELEEDSIGLYARATITDKEVIEKARNNELVGWSFGFYDREVEEKVDEDGFPLRDVRDLDLEEVSILDNTTTPAYDGTLVQVRAEGKSIYFGETFAEGIIRRDIPEEKEVQDHPESDDMHINYDKWDELISDMKTN